MKRILKNILAVTLALTVILSGTLTSFGAEANQIKVQYNGKNLSFTGEVKMVNGKIMVPFRQVLEAMGAEASYDSNTKALKAKLQDKEISLPVGGTEATVVENNEKSTVKMDASPYIDKNTKAAYVPVRAVTESLGYGVGWDKAEKTVVIIDPATIFSNVDKDFSVISKLMKSDLDLEKSYQTDGKFDMSIITYAEPKSVTPPLDMSFSGKISGIQQKTNADFAMNLAFNFDKMLKTLTTEQQTAMGPLLSNFKNVDMKIKMNGETGVTYMNSTLFTAMDPKMTENTWYKMNVYDTYEKMGIDMKSLTSMSYSGMKPSKMLEKVFTNFDYADTSTYQDMKTTYAFCRNLIGDSAFTKKSGGAYNTYTLKLDKASMLAAMAKTALEEGISKDAFDLTEIGKAMNDLNFGADIMIMERDGSLNRYELKGSFSAKELTCTYDMAGDQKNAEGNFDFDMKNIMKMTGKVESHISETAQAPDINLPANAKVVDYPVYPTQLNQ